MAHSVKEFDCRHRVCPPRTYQRPHAPRSRIVKTVMCGLVLSLSFSPEVSYTRTIGTDSPFSGLEKLKNAVEICVTEKPKGDCTCSNGCGDYYGPIADWDVSKVTDMEGLFNDLSFSIKKPSLFKDFNQNLGTWDTSKVTRMRKMLAFRRVSDII